MITGVYGLAITFGELLGMFERKSMELDKLKKTVEEMKEL